MTVATLRDVLGPAMRDGYAVAGLVVLGWEDALAYVEAADEAAAPIVLQAGPGCREHIPVRVLGPMFRTLAEGARVPVVCHIDHATTAKECFEGIEHGFTSVMFDGSRLPIEENIAATRAIVAHARPAGVSVEGEVGFVGYAEGAPSAVTRPEEAARFERETGVDALAVSIGNVHLQRAQAARIDFEALDAIEAVTSGPLVLHGASGIPAELRRRLARDTRVSKFNVGTALRAAFGAALRDVLAARKELFDRNEILRGTIPALRRETLRIIRDLRGGDAG